MVFAPLYNLAVPLTGRFYNQEMLLLIIALLVILALFGAGFALHVLWWVAIAALVIFLVSFFLRR